MDQEPNQREKLLLRIAMFVFASYMLVQAYCLFVDFLQLRK